MGTKLHHKHPMISKYIVCKSQNLTVHMPAPPLGLHRGFRKEPPLDGLLLPLEDSIEYLWLGYFGYIILGWVCNIRESSSGPSEGVACRSAYFWLFMLLSAGHFPVYDAVPSSSRICSCWIKFKPLLPSLAARPLNAEALLFVISSFSRSWFGFWNCYLDE